MMENGWSFEAGNEPLALRPIHFSNLTSTFVRHIVLSLLSGGMETDQSFLMSVERSAVPDFDRFSLDLSCFSTATHSNDKRKSHRRPGVPDFLDHPNQSDATASGKDNANPPCIPPLHTFPSLLDADRPESPSRRRYRAVSYPGRPIHPHPDDDESPYGSFALPEFDADSPLRNRSTMPLIVRKRLSRYMKRMTSPAFISTTSTGPVVTPSPHSVPVRDSDDSEPPRLDLSLPSPTQSLFAGAAPQPLELSIPSIKNGRDGLNEEGDSWLMDPVLNASYVRSADEVDDSGVAFSPSKSSPRTKKSAAILPAEINGENTRPAVSSPRSSQHPTLPSLSPPIHDQVSEKASMRSIIPRTASSGRLSSRSTLSRLSGINAVSPDLVFSKNEDADVGDEEDYPARRGSSRIASAGPGERVVCKEGRPENWAGTGTGTGEHDKSRGDTRVESRFARWREAVGKLRYCGHGSTMEG